MGKDILTDWQIYPLDIDGAIVRGWPHSVYQKTPPSTHTKTAAGPAFYYGTLPPNGLAWDSFLKLKEWTKVFQMDFLRFTNTSVSKKVRTNKN